jgi:glycosyltransferase involved in cell wall biosynthesis
MRVLIYAPSARMGGARSHVLGLIPELVRLAPTDETLLLAQPDLLVDLPPLPSSWAVQPERAETRGFVGRFVWEQRTLSRIAKSWHADVLLSFGSFVPLRAPCPTVLEAGNALPFTRHYWQVLGSQSPRLRLEERARWTLLRASLNAAERILTPSRAMRQDVVTRLPGLGPKIDVALWGVAPIFHQLRWHQPADEVVLGVSKHGINKEFDLLLVALADLRRTRPGLRLVLTGTVDESQWSRKSMALAHRLGVAKQVCFAGDLPNDRVPLLIQQSRLLVFPTWCESFGLPLAEALALGAPALAADIPACREVGEDAAWYYTPGDPRSLAQRIGELLSSEDATRALAERALARGRAFSWRDNAVAVRQSLLKAIA